MSDETRRFTSTTLVCTDALAWLRGAPDDSVDLVVGSPPYEDSRTYGIDFRLKNEDWVKWMFNIILESTRVSKGLVAFVVAGKTRKFRWSATPVLLMADLHRAGIHLRNPVIFHRVGIPGSGGPDWFRADTEFIVCATAGGKLPWSDNCAMGHPPKWAPGGAMSHRLSDGIRKTMRRKNGTEVQGYKPPGKANPGNLISVKVGGGLLGSKLAHENEAPFPERIAEWFIKSCCPPGGIVLDPFIGSGTTAAVAILTGRKAIGLDIRQSQIALSTKRVREARRRLNQSGSL